MWAQTHSRPLQHTTQTFFLGCSRVQSSNGASSNSQPGLILNIAQAWCKMTSQRKTNSFNLQTYLVCTDLKILPYHGLHLGVGLGNSQWDDWILYEGLGQRTAIAYHMDPCRAQFSACWLNRKIQKTEKNTGQDWSKMCNPEILWKKPTLSSFSSLTCTYC